MARKPWFTNWFNSPYYHQLYSHRDDREAHTFLERLTTYLQPAPGSAMLDMACGRGRHSRTLAALGYTVTGVDVAPENIRYAKRYETEQLHFRVHDMRQVLCEHCFDYVFNFFTSFGYFDTLAEHEQALHTMVTALRTGGVLVIDYLNVELAAQSLLPIEEKTIKGVHYRVERYQDLERFYKRITVSDPQQTEPLVFTEQVYKFSASQLTQLLRQQGMTLLHTWGDYGLHPYEVERSPRLILVAKRN